MTEWPQDTKLDSCAVFSFQLPDTGISCTYRTHRQLRAVREKHEGRELLYHPHNTKQGKVSAEGGGALRGKEASLFDPGSELSLTKRESAEQKQAETSVTANQLTIAALTA